MSVREIRYSMKYFGEDYFVGLKNVIIEYTLRNYDYCYLRAMHEKTREKEQRPLL